MKLSRGLFAAVLTSMCLAFISHAAEKKISPSDLPPAVQKAAAEQSKGATVSGYSRDYENGRVEYEMEMTIDGHSKDVSIAKDGSILEVEEQVEMAALPANVQGGLKAKAGKGEFTKIESITKHGMIVAYEAQVKTATGHKEIQVGPDGKSLGHQE